MSDLDMPGGDDPATDGDLESTEERLADDVGTEPPDDGGRSTIPTVAPPD